MITEPNEDSFGFHSTSRTLLILLDISRNCSHTSHKRQIRKSLMLVGIHKWHHATLDIFWPLLITKAFCHHKTHEPFSLRPWRHLQITPGSKIIVPEVWLVAGLGGVVTAAGRLVLAVLAVRVPVALPIQGDASSRWTFELKRKTFLISFLFFSFVSYLVMLQALFFLAIFFSSYIFAIFDKFRSIRAHVNHTPVSKSPYLNGVL
jgi:hypothetical protein